MKGKASSLRGFVVSIHGVFEDVVLFAVHSNGRTFERKFLGVAIQLLKQSSTHAEGEIVG